MTGLAIQLRVPYTIITTLSSAFLSDGIFFDLFAGFIAEFAVKTNSGIKPFYLTEIRDYKKVIPFSAYGPVVFIPTETGQHFF